MDEDKREKIRVEARKILDDFAKALEKVKINEGPFKDFEGEVQEINNEKNSLIVRVEIFGRLTPVELDFNQVQKI